MPIGQGVLKHISEHIKVAAASPFAAQAGETIVKGAKAAGDAMGPIGAETVKLGESDDTTRKFKLFR